MGIFCLIFLVNQLMEMSGLIGFLKGKGNKLLGVIQSALSLRPLCLIRV